MPIRNLLSRQILDSCGNPTVEVDLITDLGLFRASVPSGNSKGEFEALELRDDDPKYFYGKSVRNAINNVNEIICPELKKTNLEVTKQTEIDEFLLALDGTENKSHLGVNAILAVSMVVAKAGAAKRGIPLYKHIADLAGNTDIILPVPIFNLLNGGQHSSNKLAIQEFLILPCGALTFGEAMKMGCEVYNRIKPPIVKKFGINALAATDQGGFAVNIKSNKDAFTLIKKAINEAGYTGRIEIAIDVAAMNFFKEGKYDMNFKAKKKTNPKKWLTADKLFKLYTTLKKTTPIASISDPFGPDVWKPWNTMIQKWTEVQIVADQVAVSNLQRMEEIMQNNACNCLALKMNQIGTVTESIKVHQLARKYEWGTIVSDRYGETEETFIADFAVGISSGQIKCGGLTRIDRLSKYNQLMRIEEEMGADAKYAGRSYHKPQNFPN